jgi:hypothetical protein
MATKGISMLSLIVAVIVCLIVYIICLKLMWDWQERTENSSPIGEQISTVLLVSGLMGILTFLGYVILSSEIEDDQLTMFILWGLAVQLLVSAHVSYFVHNLKAETGYLLMILLVLFVVLAVKLNKVNMYGSIVSGVGGMITLFLHLKAAEHR